MLASKPVSAQIMTVYCTASSTCNSHEFLARCARPGVKVKRGLLKMGDPGSLFYHYNGDPGSPRSPSKWGSPREMGTSPANLCHCILEQLMIVIM